jgi:hypothetical protein
MSHIHAWQVVTLIVLAAVMLYVRRRQKAAATDGGQNRPAGAAGPSAGGGARKPVAKAEGTPEEVYAEMRRQAIATNPKRLAMTGELQPEEPYGVLMEMGSAASVVTLACFADGDARILYKTGGGMIGGISHENVRKAAKELVVLAQKALPRMTPAASYPLPGPDRVRFYVLTRRGVLTAETSRQALGERQTDLSSLFQSGQEVVAQMRQVEEQRSQPAS